LVINFLPTAESPLGIKVFDVFIGLAYYPGKDIVFRFIIEYSSLRDFGP
jgi:hypothetical protein